MFAAYGHCQTETAFEGHSESNVCIFFIFFNTSYFLSTECIQFVIITIQFIFAGSFDTILIPRDQILYVFIEGLFIDLLYSIPNSYFDLCIGYETLSG